MESRTLLSIFLFTLSWLSLPLILPCFSIQHHLSTKTPFAVSEYIKFRSCCLYALPSRHHYAVLPILQNIPIVSPRCLLLVNFQSFLLYLSHTFTLRSPISRHKPSSAPCIIAFCFVVFTTAIFPLVYLLFCGFRCNFLFSNNTSGRVRSKYSYLWFSTRINVLELGVKNLFSIQVHSCTN